MNFAPASIYHIDEIRQVISIGEVKEAVRNALIAHGDGAIVCPPPGQLLFDRPRGDCHIKYASKQDGDAFVVKVATGFYENPSLGLPVNNGMVLLFSAKTGGLIAIFHDEGWLTSWRTAAAGSLAALAGCPSTVKRLGIIGTGHQAELQAAWASGALGGVGVTIWGRSADRATQLALSLQEQGMQADTSSTVEQLLHRCNVVISCTSSASPLVLAEHVQEGTHIVSIGADSSGKAELEPALFTRASAIATDDHDHCLENGDFGKAVRAGFVAVDADIHVGKVLDGTSRLRSSDSDITIATLIGVAAQDLAIATLVWKGIGQERCNRASSSRLRSSSTSSAMDS
jgi:ornithine cyclodeaminase